MHKPTRFAVLSAALMMWLLPALGQGAQTSVEMADTMRGNGKIYVVVAVLLTILAGLILYLVSLDRKITRLEKENK